MKPKSILDPTFEYTNAASTDLKKTFARIRREQRKQETSKTAEQLAHAAPVVAEAVDAIANLGEVMRLAGSVAVSVPVPAELLGEVVLLRRKGAK